VGTIDVWAQIITPRTAEARWLEPLLRWTGQTGKPGVPWLWNLPPDDELYHPVYAACVDAGVPFCTQSGHTGPLLRSETGRPIPYLEDVLLDLPELVVVGGHVGFPWVNELVSLTIEFPNFHSARRSSAPRGARRPRRVLGSGPTHPPESGRSSGRAESCGSPEPIGSRDEALDLRGTLAHPRPGFASRAGSVVRNGLLHRASQRPGLSYELAPGRDLTHLGVRDRINSHGMRGREPLPDSLAPVRIAVIGGSRTFDHAVDESDIDPVRLGNLLDAAAAGSGVRFDVLDFGVSGDSTRDEVAVLEQVALPRKSRLMIVGYTLDDPELEPLHIHFQRVRWWQHLAST